MGHATYSAALDTRRHRAMLARERDRAAVVEYRAALDRLRSAQAAYDALDDPRADWQHVQAACRALVIARADIESLSRYCRCGHVQTVHTGDARPWLCAPRGVAEDCDCDQYRQLVTLEDAY